jgi:hypothetical protein
MFVPHPKNPVLMKRIIYSTLCLSLITLIFGSCKKSGNDDGGGNSSYYIKGKKDGVAFNYNQNSMAKIIDFSSTANTISLALFANSQPNAASLEGLNVTINFFNGKSPATGIYTEDYTGLDYLAAGVYNPNSMTITWAAGMHSPTVKSLKINILTKTATEMTGTFEGAFYKQDSSIPAFYDDYTLFTECEFKLPIK